MTPLLQNRNNRTRKQKDARVAAPASIETEVARRWLEPGNFVHRPAQHNKAGLRHYTLPGLADPITDGVSTLSKRTVPIRVKQQIGRYSGNALRVATVSW